MSDVVLPREAARPGATVGAEDLAPAPAAGPPGMARPDFQIVPLAGLPIAAVILAGVVAAIVSNQQWALDFFHVAGGGLWTGIDLFVGFVVGPILGRLSIPARVEFSTRFMPKMLVVMPVLVTVTLAAGWQLARHLGTIAAGDPHHGWVVASMIVVGVMALVALGLLEPANVAVLFELKKPQPDGELIARLMRRFVYAAGVTGAMQVATLVIMSKLASS